MYDELGCSCDTARTAKARMIRQAASLLRNQFVKRQSGGRVVFCDVLTNLLPIGTRPGGSKPSSLVDVGHLAACLRTPSGRFRFDFFG